MLVMLLYTEIIIIINFPTFSVLKKRLNFSHHLYQVPALAGLDPSNLGSLVIVLPTVAPTDIESLQNRLLKVWYVPATSASLNRLLFFLFCCGH
jgi:hypothetical protein